MKKMLIPFLLVLGLATLCIAYPKLEQLCQPSCEPAQVVNNSKKDICCTGDSGNAKNASTALACKLTNKELAKREGELKKVIFSKAQKITENNDSYELVFKESEDFSLKLVEYINLERQCCPFFTFSMTFEPQEGIVKLKIGESSEIKNLLKTELKGMGVI
jgi:hypothetical protein